MSKANLEQFMKRVAASDDLQSRTGDEIAGDALVTLGAEYGWEFTTDDLLAAAELSDGELEGVSGWLSRASINLVFGKNLSSDFGDSPGNLGHGDVDMTQPRNTASPVLVKMLFGGKGARHR